MVEAGARRCGIARIAICGQRKAQRDKGQTGQSGQTGQTGGTGGTGGRQQDSGKSVLFDMPNTETAIAGRGWASQQEWGEVVGCRVDTKA
jgi:hypothetical protein